jgi:hypothetical protein
MFNSQSNVIDVTGLITFTIANNASLSDAAVNLGGVRCAGIVMPAAWTAASLTFLVSVDGATYYPLYVSASEFAVTVAASQYVALNPDNFTGIRFLQIRSGTVGSPVNQGAERTVMVVTIPV